MLEMLIQIMLIIVIFLLLFPLVIALSLSILESSYPELAGKLEERIIIKF